LKLIERTKKKVVAALVYPAILFGALIVAATFLMLWVVPRFAGFFEGFHAELPILTVALLAVAETLRDHILMIASVFFAGGVAIYLWSQRAGSRILIDQLKLKIPFLGPVIHTFATSQLTRALGTLLYGGIPLVQAIEIAAESVQNRFVGGKVSPVANRVREGKSFSASLDATGQFSNMAIEMTKVGETTGSLANMLESVADFSDEEIENRLELMLAMLTPVVLMFLGGFVALILLALYLPLFSIARVAR
jgi:type IV pilus assembly protein PilC